MRVKKLIYVNHLENILHEVNSPQYYYHYFYCCCVKGNKIDNGDVTIVYKSLSWHELKKLTWEKSPRWLWYKIYGNKYMPNESQWEFNYKVRRCEQIYFLMWSLKKDWSQLRCSSVGFISTIYFLIESYTLKGWSGLVQRGLRVGLQVQI